MKKFILLFFLHGVIGVALAQNNTILGSNAGNGSLGTENVSLGFYAGDVCTGSSNTFVGSYAGLRSTTCIKNTFVGFAGGFSVTTGNYNSYFGNGAGYKTTTGLQNTFLGSSAGYQNDTGGYNVYVGESSGANNSNGTRNTFVGQGSGMVSTNSDNCFVGNLSGSKITSGAQNTFLGVNTGLNTILGSGNVFLGYNAGYYETNSNKLYIDNSNTATPLIYGDFNSNQVGINALPSSTYALTVGGTINATDIIINNQSIGGNVSNWATSGTNLYSLNSNVNVGIGTTSPAYKLDVSGVINASSILINGSPFAGGGSQWTTQANTANIYYNGAGTVGIGTTTTGSFKLAVEGKIGAREVNVTTTNPWPDYVFDDSYALPSLQKLKAYIKINKHLPEVPSASAIEANGVNLGEMNAILLKKVEEITLYMLEQQKEIELLKKQMSGKGK